MPWRCLPTPVEGAGYWDYFDLVIDVSCVIIEIFVQAWKRAMDYAAVYPVVDWHRTWLHGGLSLPPDGSTGTSSAQGDSMDCTRA